MRHADKLEAFFDEKLQAWQKLFSTYKEFAPKPESEMKKSNTLKRFEGGYDKLEPEPYVPSFMKIESPQKFDIKEKPRKCFVCQKLGTETNTAYKCSKCKRAYHANCYVPALKRDPPRDWNCIMCVNVDDLADQPNEPNKEGGKLGKRDYLICSRLFLEMHKVWPDCKTFLAMEALNFSLYRSVVDHPIALDLIRKRMDRKYPLQYESIKEFLKDLRLMFKNCKKFWKDQPAGENFVRHADNLKSHLDKCLQMMKSLIEEDPDERDRKQKEKDKKQKKDKRYDKSDEEETYSKSRSMRYRGDGEDDNHQTKKPGPAFSKRNISKMKASRDQEEDSEIDEEMSLSTMKMSLSKSSSSSKQKEASENTGRRPGPASSKQKSTSNSRKERDESVEDDVYEGANEKIDSKDYQCNYCDAVYNKISKMQDHTLNHFEEKLTSLLPSSKPYLCPTCKDKSHDSDSLMRHYAFDCEEVSSTQECIRKNLERSG